jgi:hypothetical protein
MDSNGKNRKSIVTDKVTAYQTPPTSMSPNVGWDVNKFETLIQTQGYDAFIDRALRCPCVDKATGQALSTCKNCLGRGWFFVDRTETRLIAQHMDSNKRYENWSEVNRGTASITTKGIDKLGFMDKIILTQLEEFYSEIIRPIYFQGEIIAYPVYEPLKVTDMFLFASDNEKLINIKEDEYVIDGNKIVFDLGIQDKISIDDMNVKNKSEIPISISIRYSHFPVYHVIDVNRELMKVRESRFCSYNDEKLRQMPINVLARKAHYLFDAQKFGEESFENTVLPAKERE